MVLIPRKRFQGFQNNFIHKLYVFTQLRSKRLHILFPFGTNIKFSKNLDKFIGQ